MKKIYLSLLYFLITLNLFSIENGLVAHYPFNGDATDVIGGNNGTVVGAELTTDRFGNEQSAYQFSGNGDYVAIDHFDLTDTFTITAWVKIDDFSSGNSIFGNYPGSYAPTEGFELLANTNTDKNIKIHTNGRNSTLNAPEIDLETNKWYFIVASYDGEGNCSIYANNLLLSSGSNLSNYIPSSSSTKIGASVNSTSNNFSGIIDDLRIYNKVISSEEMNDLFMERICTEKVTETITIYAIDSQDQTSTIINDEINIVAYPNPVNTNIQIKAESVIISVELYDARGLVVLTEEVNTKAVEINFDEIAQGAYILKVVTENGTSTQIVNIQ